MNVVKIKFEDLGKSQSVFSYSRTLKDQGYPKETRLEVYRDRLNPDLIVKQIGRIWDYSLTETDRGFRIQKYKPFPNLKGV